MIKVKNLSKKYSQGKNVVTAIDDITFSFNDNISATIVGPSGSGKSTLLNILGGLDSKYTGSITIDDKDIKKYNKNYYRRYVIGTIFQQFYLVPSLTVEENILLPIRFGKQLNNVLAKERLSYLLDRVDLKNRAKHKPSELSGGQAQRVAIARALIAKPKIILADEPTGNLDSKTGKEISKLLFDLQKEENATLIIVTHDNNLFSNVDKSIHLMDGRITNV